MGLVHKDLQALLVTPDLPAIEETRDQPVNPVPLDNSDHPVHPVIQDLSDPSVNPDSPGHQDLPDRKVKRVSKAELDQLVKRVNLDLSAQLGLEEILERRVTTDNPDHRDQLEVLGSPVVLEIQELQGKLDHKVNQVKMDRRDLVDNPAQLASKDNLAHRDQLVRWAVPDRKDLWEVPVAWDRRVRKEISALMVPQGHPEHLEQLAAPEQWVRQDHSDPLVQRDQLVHRGA